MGPLSFEQRVRQGNCYTVTSPQLTVAIASNARFTLSNPSGSGKNIIIYCLETYIASGTASYASIFSNPTTNLPAAALTPVNQNLTSANTSSAVVKADANLAAMSGGTTMFTLPVPTGERVAYKEQLLIIPPGMMVGINAPLLLATNGSFKLDFWEEIL